MREAARTRPIPTAIKLRDRCRSRQRGCRQVRSLRAARSRTRNDVRLTVKSHDSNAAVFSREHGGPIGRERGRAWPGYHVEIRVLSPVRLSVTVNTPREVAATIRRHATWLRAGRAPASRRRADETPSSALAERSLGGLGRGDSSAASASRRLRSGSDRARRCRQRLELVGTAPPMPGSAPHDRCESA